MSYGSDNVFFGSENVFEDKQILDDLIVSYCDTFGATIGMEQVSQDWDNYQDTNDSYYDEMEVPTW